MKSLGKQVMLVSDSMADWARLWGSHEKSFMMGRAEVSKPLTLSTLAREACRLLVNAGKPGYVTIWVNEGTWAECEDGTKKHPRSHMRWLRLSQDTFDRLTMMTVDEAAVELWSLLGLKRAHVDGSRCDYCGLKAREADQRCDGCGAPR